MDKFIECDNALIKVNNLKSIIVKDDRESLFYKNNKEAIESVALPFDYDSIKKKNENIDKFPYIIKVTVGSSELVVFRSSKEEECIRYIREFTNFITDKTTSIFRFGDNITYMWYAIENEDFSQSWCFYSYTYDQAIKEIKEKVRCNLQYLTNKLGSDNILDDVPNPTVTYNNKYYTVVFRYAVNNNERKLVFYIAPVVQFIDFDKESELVCKDIEQEKTEKEDKSESTTDDTTPKKSTRGRKKKTT